MNPNPIWEAEIYSKGRHLNLYPFDSVVSFLFRWKPHDKRRAETGVLEIGCGAGNNLWFAAREGFRVAGIDASDSAIHFGRQRFAAENLEGDLRTGNFLELPWGNEIFEMGVDRCSLACVSDDAQHVAVAEMYRVLRVGGVFCFNTYSEKHTSAKSGEVLADGRITNIRAGTLVGVGALMFSSRSQIDALFAEGWEILNLEHVVFSDTSPKGKGEHAEWRGVARKK